MLGHERALSRLQRVADDDALTHALLLTGPDGVGKTTTALSLAEHILDADRWPGGLFAHPDIWVEDSGVENISIERIRAGGRDAPTLQDFLALRPYAGAHRVAVIGRAERLTEQAANCMLKTIEEPPPSTHLLLCAAHFERLPQTVLSRCETVVLAPIPADAISAWLAEETGMAPERATLIAALAGGRPGRALRLARERGALESELAALDTFLAAGGGGLRAALQAAATVTPGAGAEGRERALTTLNTWASFVRDAACYASGAPELALWSTYRPALERWAEDLPAERIVAILDRIARASEAVAAYALPRLAFEALLVDIFGGTDSPPPVEARELAAGGAVRATGDAARAGTPSRRRAGRRG